MSALLQASSRPGAHGSHGGHGYHGGHAAQDARGALDALAALPDLIVREAPLASEPLVLGQVRHQGQHQTVRVVESGGIDLFHVGLVDGLPQGARRHVCRLAAGDPLFDSPGEASHGLLAVALPDTVWLRLQGEAPALLEHPAAGPAVKSLFERWLAMLEAAAPGGSLHGMAPEAAGREILRRLGERRQQQDASEEALIRARISSDAQSLRRALASVAQVLDGDAASGVAVAGHALADACDIVLRAGGIRMHKHGPLPADASPDDWLAAYCARAGAARRRVSLNQAEWWKLDLGPLLAFRAADNAPVALLPDAGGYLLRNPAGAAAAPPRRVDRALAAELAPSAFMFFRQLPAHAIGFTDLLRFGLAGSVRDRWRLLAFGLAGGILGLATPFVTGLLIDAALPAADRSQLLQLVLMLALGAVCATGLTFCRGPAVMRIQTRLGNAAQAAVIDRLTHLPAPFFRDYESGDLARRALGIDSILLMLSTTAESDVFGWLFGLFSLLYLFFLDLRLALLAIALVGAELLWTLALDYAALLQERGSAKVSGDIASRVFQILNGIAKLRAHGAERRAYALWASLFARQKIMSNNVRRIGIALSTADAGYSLLCSMALFAIVAWIVPDMATGQFLAFSSAFGQFLAATLAMTSALSSVLSAIPLYERARPILQALPEASGAGHAAVALQGAIEISGVSFRYQADGPLILDDISISIRAGEFIALVGPSGCGKSTLCRLLLGFEQPHAGAIYYDGQDLAGLAVAAVRRQMGVVLQNGRLMAGDIFTNIVGASPLGMADAWEAARMAGLDRDIEAMPMGMHTMIAEGASTISGGQRQRLLVARAVVRKPRILMFDEATSALDNHTQAIVADSIAGLHATRVVVAHRLSTIVGADSIFYIEGGRIVEQGNFQELMALDGRFAALAERQLA